jgi:hypothetical protein
MTDEFRMLDKLSKLDGFSMVPGPDYPEATADGESKYLVRYLAENGRHLYDDFYVRFLRVCGEFYLQDESSEDFALRRDGTVLSFGPHIDESMEPDRSQEKYPFCSFGFVSRIPNQSYPVFAETFFAESNADSVYNGVWVQTLWGAEQTAWRFFCDSFASWLDLLVECSGDFRKSAPWRSLGLDS